MIGYGNSMFLATHGILARSGGGGGVDPDAQAFITAAAITDPTQQAAINTLVVDLKGYNIWTKMKGLWPMVGGTATTMKWNLKDPRDLDAAYRLLFIGGGTWDANGYRPNGSNGYADTRFVPSTILNVNSNSLGYYTGSNIVETDLDPIPIGSLNSASQSFILGKTNTTFISRVNGNLVSFLTTAMRGFFSASKQTSTLTDLYVNGAQVATGNSGGTLPNLNTWIGALQIGSGYGFVKNDFRFAYISDGLTDTEVANFYTAVQAFQTSLSRNI
jgi:hypothetical protein